jgi:DNA-binding transcriptional ArsR family regulator
MNGMEAADRWELYRVLAEPVRLRVLALVAKEELTVGELAELLHESQPNASRHVAPLRDAAIVSVRKQGTRSLVRMRDGAELDAVVADALASGRALTERDGSLARVAEVVRARDADTREYFGRLREPPGATTIDFGPYVAALAQLLPSRAVAVDAGTGDGALLEVLAPAFSRVIAVDRSEAQLQDARARVAQHGLRNVEFFPGEIADAALQYPAAASVVFAVRLLHHAPSPRSLVHRLAQLLAPGGALLLLDYARHEDEQMREQADLWLGFDSGELRALAVGAGLIEPVITPLPAPRGGRDAHLPWQLLFARAPDTNDASAPTDATPRRRSGRSA